MRQLADDPTTPETGISKAILSGVQFAWLSALLNSVAPLVNRFALRSCSVVTAAFGTAMLGACLVLVLTRGSVCGFLSKSMRLAWPFFPRHVTARSCVGAVLLLGSVIALSRGGAPVRDRYRPPKPPVGT